MISKNYLVVIALLTVLYFSTNCSSFQTSNTKSEGWYGWGCPPHATGQFPYMADCKRFYNCFKGRGQLSICAPGTLFNPSTLECDFPSKVTCIQNDGKNNNNDRLVNANEGYPLRSHHHPHHHYHHHKLHSHQYSQDGSEDVHVHSSAHQGNQQYSWQYHGSQPSSSIPNQPSINTMPTKNEGFPMHGYHAGVQPPAIIAPSSNLQPPPPTKDPVYIINPPYVPVLPAQPILDHNQKFPALPALSSSTAKVASINQQHFSRAHSAPSPPVFTYNQYQPNVPRQVFHTKTHPQASANRQTIGTSYIQDTQFSSSQRSTGYKPIVFPESNEAIDNPESNNNQDLSGEEVNYKKESGHILFSTPSIGIQYVPPLQVIPNSNPVQNPTFSDLSNIPKDVCPEGFSGLTAHSDCTKFLSCSHGRTFVMNCSPGTRFNPELLICDFKYNVKCDDHFGNSQIINQDDLIQPEETKHEINIFRSSDLNTENSGSDLTPEIEAVENVTDSTINNSKISISAVDVTTTPSYVTVSLIPRIKIKNLSINETEIVHQHNSTNSKQSFKPETLPTLKARLISKRNSTLDKQVLRLRGSPSQFEGFVEMQLSAGSWGVVCDKHNDWKIEEAHVVCRSLGYPRGAELTWQGLPTNVKNTTSTILASDAISCSGSEDSFLDCTFSIGNGCDPNKDGVWVRCYSHGLSKCNPEEMSLGDRCYSIVVPNEESSTENLVGFTQGEALAHCQKKGGQLVDITSQVENDFVSEWLIRQNIEGSIMTSGVGMSLMGGSIWIWEGSESTFTYHNWWPGWNSAKSIPPQTYTSRALCIVLKRYFPCKESKGTEDRLCDAQYYYWDVEDCDAMSTSLPYVCERPANKIGCVVGTGTGYKGAANVTKAGSICLSWDHNDILQELKYRISEADRKVSLSGHNYCRNIAGKETHPWCFVRETPTLIKKELCDIPICSEGLEKSARYFQCPSNYFSCGTSGKCIPKSLVCDGNSDCSYSEDESDCLAVLSQFTLFENSKLIVADVGFFNAALTSCAQSCLELVNCRSFSFLVAEEKCVLNELNIGLSGNLSQASGWNYYEVKSKSIQCNNSFECDNGKCITQETVCNGRNDCGDRSDEKNCSWLKQKIQIKLSGGNKLNEGTIEVKAHDKWGLVCDDEFELKDGDVVCRHLGYPLGAAEIKKHSSFNHNHSMNFIIDNLNCIGNETSIADCFHNGWGIHDCQAEEAAGVVCKLSKSECSFNYWQCEKSAECIPLAFLCDNVKDCKDNSDEDPVRCESPIQVRLVGTGGVSRSNKANEGRVEVRRFGVWGTVCDDDFGVQEAKVVCGALGYSGSAQVYKEAAYGAGEGIIWLDQVHCIGNESSLHQCMSDGWGQTNCKHNEDVAISCSNHFGNGENGMTKSIDKNKVLHENTIEIEESNILLEDIFMPDCGMLIDLGVTKNHVSPKVVSGFETIKGTYPWQASIRLKGIAGKSTHWCGAVVVTRFHVLTAGHCLRDYAKSAYFIRAGDYDNEVDEGTEQDMEIDEMWIHSAFDKGVKLNNDIALVKIKGIGFEFNTWVLPACLPQNNLLIPDNCTISGWGSSANPGTGFARTLHATWLQPIPLENCMDISIYSSSLSAGMMCAGNLKGGPDSCQGDSGGPLLCPIESQFTLFGITSWGHGCGRTNSPGVYTNVSYYLNWINDRIKLSMKKLKYRKVK